MYTFEELFIYVILAFIIGYLVREVFDIIAINDYLIKTKEEKNNGKKNN